MNIIIKFLKWPFIFVSNCFTAETAEIDKRVREFRESRCYSSDYLYDLR